MKTFSEDRRRLDCERSRAARYFCEHYERGQRYLLVFARDFAEYLRSADWLKSEEAKSFQRYYDFLCDFERLRDLMKENRWSKEFLKENGIDFAAVKKLYFAVA